jgi:hypothetical protein
MIVLQQTKHSAVYRRLYEQDENDGAVDITDVYEPEIFRKLSPAMKKAMKEAEKKQRYYHSHPEELRETLKKLQQGPPLFGGIGADEFKRKYRDEWN